MYTSNLLPRSEWNFILDPTLPRPIVIRRFNLRAQAYASQEHKYVQEPRPKMSSSGLNSYFGVQAPYQPLPMSMIVSH